MNTANIFPAMMGAFGIVFIVLFFVLLAIWIALPFSIFGVKDLIREVIEEQKKTNELLKNLLKEKPAPAGSKQGSGVRSQESEERRET
jgi:predicted membrane protein